MCRLGYFLNAGTKSFLQPFAEQMFRQMFRHLVTQSFLQNLTGNSCQLAFFFFIFRAPYVFFIFLGINLEFAKDTTCHYLG